VLESDLGRPAAAVIGPDWKSAPADISIVPIEPSAAGRFRVSVDSACGYGCVLVFMFGGDTVLPVGLEPSPPSAMLDIARWSDHRFQAIPAPVTRVDAVKLAALEVATSAYQLVGVPLFVIAFGCVVVLAWRSLGARRVDSAVAVSVGLLVGVLVRLVALALVDATSSPAINVLYGAPASALYVAFVSLGLCAGSALIPSRRVAGPESSSSQASRF
jgi:hypothetical protein